MANERCPICRKDISHELPDSNYPELCGTCAKKEYEFACKRRVWGKIIHPEQRKLF